MAGLVSARPEKKRRPSAIVCSRCDFRKRCRQLIQIPLQFLGSVMLDRGCLGADHDYRAVGAEARASCGEENDDKRILATIIRMCGPLRKEAMTDHGLQAGDYHSSTAITQSPPEACLQIDRKASKGCDSAPLVYQSRKTEP